MSWFSGATLGVPDPGSHQDILGPRGPTCRCPGSHFSGMPFTQIMNLFLRKITKKMIKRQWHNNDNITAEINWNRTSTLNFLTLFRMGFFGAAHGWGGEPKSPPPSKICHTYPTMIKLGTDIPYLKKFQKLYESPDTPFAFCWHQHFLPEISKFFYIKKYRYRFHLDT